MARSFGAGWLFLMPLTLLAQEPPLPVPPNVAVDGVPGVPMKLVSTVAPYGQFRRAQLGVLPRLGAVFLPRGEAIVFQKDTAGGGEANQLFRYGAASGALTLFPDGKSRNGIPVKFLLSNEGSR